MLALTLEIPYLLMMLMHVDAKITPFLSNKIIPKPLQTPPRPVVESDISIDLEPPERPLPEPSRLRDYRMWQQGQPEKMSPTNATPKKHQTIQRSIQTGCQNMVFLGYMKKSQKKTTKH